MDRTPHTPPPVTPDQPVPNTTPQPVAYDQQGRPLYAHPPTQQVVVEQPQVVHLARPVSPAEVPISPAIAKKHEDSKRMYPFLNLSPGEYVISAVRRHPIGLILPVSVTLFLAAVLLTVLIQYEEVVASFDTTGAFPGIEAAFFPLVALLVAVLFGGFVVVYVYLANKFFLTNESVIQEIQHTIFSRNEQTVSLANIEDASFRQIGILQQLLDYGSIRLSTEGDETTYRFNYVSHPKKQIATLNNAVEAFKNGRPIDPNDN